MKNYFLLGRPCQERFYREIANHVESCNLAFGGIDHVVDMCIDRRTAAIDRRTIYWKALYQLCSRIWTTRLPQPKWNFPLTRSIESVFSVFYCIVLIKLSYQSLYKELLMWKINKWKREIINKKVLKINQVLIFIYEFDFFSLTSSSIKSNYITFYK